MDGGFSVSAAVLPYTLKRKWNEREADMAKKRKKPPRQPGLYTGKFVGISEAFLQPFQALSSPEREHTFFLLVTLLLCGSWDFHRPEGYFSATMRTISKRTGWHYRTIWKYLQVLIDSGLLSIKEASGFKKATVYQLNYAALGIIPSTQRSQKKQDRPYMGAFWGLTKNCLDNIHDTIPHQRKRPRDERRPRALWLLSCMLTAAKWTPVEVSEPFKLSISAIMQAAGWRSRQTTVRYIKRLVQIRALSIIYQGSRGIPANYQAAGGFLGIRGKAKNPTKRRDLSKSFEKQAQNIEDMPNRQFQKV